MATRNRRAPKNDQPEEIQEAAPEVQAEEVQQVGVAEHISRDSRLANDLRVGDLAALVALPRDQLPQAADTQPLAHGLLHVEGSGIGCFQGKQRPEVGPAQLSSQ